MSFANFGKTFDILSHRASFALLLHSNARPIKIVLLDVQNMPVSEVHCNRKMDLDNGLARSRICADEKILIIGCMQ